MNANSRVDFRKTSLAVLILYAICIAILLLRVVSFSTIKMLISVILLWAWIVGPQFLLSLYVSKFMTRWAQFASLLLQIVLFFSLYQYGTSVFLGYDDMQYESVFLFLPIWHYVAIVTAGIVLKLIQSY